MAASDYKITATVRRLLTSRWVDVNKMQVGTTNGVVYLLGQFEPTVDDALRRLGKLVEQGDSTARLITLVTIVDKEIRRVSGVRDVVCNLKNLRKKRGKWQVNGSVKTSVTPVTVRANVERETRRDIDNAE